MDPDRALAEGDYSTAIDLLNKKMEKDPDNAPTHFKMGEVYFMLAEAMAADPEGGGDPGSAFMDAENFFRRSLELDPKHPKAGCMLARSLYMNNRLFEAYNTIKEVIRSFPEDGPAHEFAGRVGYSLFQISSEEEGFVYLREAIENAGTAVKLSSILDTAWILLGDCLLQQGSNGAALEAYQNGISACPESSTLHDRMIYLNGAEDGIDPKGAIAFYDDLIQKTGAKLTPESKGLIFWYQGNWHGYKGGAHYGNEEYDLARKSYTRHLECLDMSVHSFPDFKDDGELMSATVRINRGWCFIQLERFEEAENDLVGAIKIQAAHGIDPGEEARTVRVVDTLGYEISRKLDYEAALGFFKRLTACWEKRHQWWNNYGFFSLETNMASDKSNDKYKETYAIYEKALELKPNYPRYVNDQAMLINYYLDPEGLRMEEAEAMFQKAWKLGKEAYESPFTDEMEKPTMLSAYTDALVNLGRMYYIQKRMDECRSMVEEVLAVTPDRMEAKMLLKAINNEIQVGSREEVRFKRQILNKN